MMRPCAEAQYMELLARFADYHAPQPEPLRPGERVEPKHGLSNIEEQDGPVALILWRYLDDNDWFDRHLRKDMASRSLCPDCLVATVDDDGGMVVLMPFDSRALQRVTE